MGMFDDIVVPKSYLKGLLDKEYEKYVETNHSFQTKSFHSLMDIYKVYRQHLYIKEYSENNQKQKWRKLPLTTTVNFYDNIQSKEGDSVWVEFDFSFVDGKLDKKELVKAEVSETKEEGEATERMWEIENKIFDKHRAKLKVKFFEWLSKILRALQGWTCAQSAIPRRVRDRAYEASGRKIHDE